MENDITLTKKSKHGWFRSEKNRTTCTCTICIGPQNSQIHGFFSHLHLKNKSAGISEPFKNRAELLPCSVHINYLPFPIWADFLSFCFNDYTKVWRLTLATKMLILSWKLVGKPTVGHSYKQLFCCFCELVHRKKF